MFTEVPVFRALSLVLSRNSAVQVNLKIWKVVALGQILGLLQSGSRYISPGKGWCPFSWMECNILDEPPNCWN
jgi:hypothetical protein